MAAEIPRERQTRTSHGRRRSIAAGAKKNRKQKTFQNGRKTKPGGSGAEVTVFWSSLLSHRGYTGEPGTQERGDEELLLTHFNWKHGNTEIAGDMNTQVMTLRLDQDTVNTEDL